MSLGQNLQFLRKRDNMTQEQLAEVLNVSRQSVSKWEADGSFPETDKILQMCDMFHCNMDDLMRGNLEEVTVEDTAQYDRHMNMFSKMIALGVGLILLGGSVQLLLEGIGTIESISDMAMLIFVTVAVFILVVAGINHTTFRQKYPNMKQFYKEEEIDSYNRKFPFLIGGGVTLILIGVIVNEGLSGVPVPNGWNAEVYDSLFMLMIAIAVSVLIYAGLQKSKYDIKTYNKDNARENSPQNKQIGKWCGVIMMCATILFLISIGIELVNGEAKFDNWRTWKDSIMVWSWLVFPVGGILCGIVSVILAKDEEEK